MTLHLVLPSPVDDLTLVSDGAQLTGVYMDLHRHLDRSLLGDRVAEEDAPPVLRATATQLGEYFAGDRQVFDLPLAPAGTQFQQRVWQALALIPYGSTWSYRRLAEEVGSPGASRAVGLANGRNPISIVVPCHRVIGADGSLTGYGGGVARKRVLLDLERRQAGACLF